MKNMPQLLDCTFRDGGYYNNWNFKITEVQKYLNHLSKTEISNIEIGFLSIPKEPNRGITANCDNNFFKKLKIPRNINCGVMINASDFTNNELKPREIYEILKKIQKKNIKFIRIACHINELSKVKDYFLFLKKRGFKVFLNIMQISEITISQIKFLCKEYKNLCDVICIADSLGALDEKKTKLLLTRFKNFTNLPLGIHAHNNMNKAFSNTIVANKNGATWLDSTMQGMGRGPGNTKTEDVISYFCGRKSNSFKIIKKLSRDFLILKKKYKWGTNKYYYLSGLYKVHPTYVQMLLSDTRYKDFNYKEIIKNLKKQNSNKFDPNELYSAMNFYRNKKINSNSKLLKIKLKKKIIIFGNGISLKNRKIVNKKFIENFTSVVINRSNYVKNNLIDLRVYCHPLRVITDINFFKERKFQFLMPYYSFPKIIQNKILKKNVVNFNLHLGSKFNLDKKKVIMPRPLGLVYALSYFIAQGFKKVYLAGFDGFDLDDPFHDQTQEYIFIIKKIFPDFKIISLTDTKLKF
jgi:4-hydroxy 2-oxovalerate aldolase